MWIVECNDHGQELRMSTHPIYGRKLRPLMPRPFTSCGTNSSSFSTTPAPPCCLHNPNIPAWNQHLSGVSDYGGKRERSTVPLVSSRWNPTPEQLQALEEMYRRGIRTPSAEQIQQIAAKLRRFGKIEGKNVFYWFQNHKARDRQKKRRQLELLAGKKMSDVETPERRQSGLSRRDLETKHPRKLPTPSDRSTASEYCVSMHGIVVEEWTQLDSKELQQQTVTAKSTQTCWPLDLSSCMPPNNSIYKVTAQKSPGQENERSLVALNLSKLLPPENDDFRILESGIKENQTLQLFPVRSNDLSTLSATEEEIHDVSSIGNKMAPNQFFEFLPTKD
ncbi:hypothetical protein Pfo_009795 [Paulownia fortunei]|nr:hypothetical protein Pfo_009795 [Paulownia fortunei]